MSADEAFFDTNVLICILSSDAAKADEAEALLAQGGVASVQVLNEFANVARRKFGAPWPAVREILDTLRSVLRIEPLTLATHEGALDIAERYRLALHDAQILAAAKIAGCGVVLSEDMQDGLRVDDVLTIRNPFRSS